jgi:glycogen synthase
VPQKGVAWLIEAAALVSSPDVSIVVVGDGPERGRLQRRVRELGLEERVSFAGVVPHAAVPALLSGFDVLVMPSVYEELGSTLVEGMWSGLPIVATRVGGIPDVVQHLRTGLLVRPADPHDLAGAIDRLAADPALAARLGRNARAEAARYDWAVLARAVADVYRSVLA